MKYPKTCRIAVLMGGLSKERDISFKTGKGMAAALRERGYENLVEIDVDQNIAQKLRDESIEVAVVALHGRFGEDGTIQSVLEYLRIPYTGTGVLGSAIAINKDVSREIFSAHQIPIATGFSVHRGQEVPAISKRIKNEIGLPVIVKPCNEGSTLGITIVEDEDHLKPAIDTALNYDDVVIVEEYIKGIELTVGFLGGQPLPVLEIAPKSGFFDFEAKYTKGKTDYFCPARISDELAKQTQEVAKQAFCAVRCDSFGRVDFIAKGDDLYVLEANTIPGMTETSLVPQAAKAAGISFEELVETILQDARLKVK